jgi:prevent-host-death family protein
MASSMNLGVAWIRRSGHLVQDDRATYFLAVFILTTAAARRKFSELVNRVWYTKERAKLTRYGQALVAVVPIEDLAILEKAGRSRAAKTAGASAPKAKQRKR